MGSLSSDKMPKIRIAILECDTPMPTVLKKYGTYADRFRTILESGGTASSHNVTVECSNFDVVTAMEYPNLEEIDGLLITGSKHNAHDDIPWVNKLVDFTQRVLAQDRVRIIGVCFGHQIVGRAMGVKVGKSDIGWETSVCKMDLTDTGKRLFDKDYLSIHQMHKDIVFSYPPEVISLGSSPKCDVQGMYIPARLITVQGHPEFNGWIMGEILEARKKQGIFDATIVQEAMERVEEPHDGELIGRAFVDFMLEDGKGK
ncbi:hypothetical protein MMC25_004959 [Agyrium rufum]|nr:hypothetical protein [Agyrium rufum]